MMKSNALPELETQERYLLNMGILTASILLAGTFILLRERKSSHNKPLLSYGCSDWTTSSQRAAELYDSGVKLWSKTDLEGIERQLAQSDTSERFTVRCIDGTIVQIQNPIVGVQRSIWKPQVQLQGYWQLVKEQPKGPRETYHCSYVVKWNNQTVRRFRESVEQLDLVFEDNKLSWGNSTSSKSLRSHLDTHIRTRKVTKIICFGLGDMCRKSPDWLRRHNESKEQNTSDRDRCMIQHSIALTLADTCRNHGGNAVQLLAQDPGYTVESMQFLEKIGFKIVGNFGAGGFAEIDEESVVFSPFAEAPVKRIIADIGRPAMVITSGFETFNDHEKPFADAESPRTQQMWQEYQSCDFPISSEEDQVIGGGLCKLKVYVRTTIDRACDQ